MRRDQILDAADALFAERAYEDFSIEDVARSAGVARGRANDYFGGRKEVYLAPLERLGAGARRGCRRRRSQRSRTGGELDPLAALDRANSNVSWHDRAG